MQRNIKRRPSRAEQSYKRPPLKWAGGKYRVLGHILSALPQGTRLVEPFAGSGAVFLNADFPAFLLCDLNADLISLYCHLQEQGEAYIDYCRSFFTPVNNVRESFLALRGRFNESRDPAERGALLLYLNRHAFNGLVRYNASGLYNVPFGRYAAPYFPEQEIRHFATRAVTRDVTFMVTDFRRTFSLLKHGDVVYADPPYAPLTDATGFTAYAGRTFGATDQTELATSAGLAARQGIPVLISNHDTPITRTLYADALLHTFTVPRMISCKGAQRHPVPELLACFGA